MSVQKRKCQKGLEHTGRWIQAVCLQPTCRDDRLLCFYCIHEAHQSHSIAYLIPGLKSPLQVLNKNSQTANSQKHMKYIQKRFTKMNNGWLAISDHLQRGITRIEDRMLPQFNVIRETFKKNSVEQIVGQLTSNQITSQKIEEYVDMINMVKEYKFNDINKLKFMAFLIQHKLSRIFVNANNKIKQIMNRVIQETNETNFLNFNAEELAKDRQLYLQISKNMSIYHIADLQINTLNWSSLIEESTLLENKNFHKREIHENDKKMDQNNFEEIQLERQSNKNQLPSQYSQLIELIEQEVNSNDYDDKQQNINDQFRMGLEHGSIIIVDQKQLEKINESKDCFKEEQQVNIRVDGDQLQGKELSKEQKENQNRSISEVSCLSQDHSNGFRSYDRALQKRQINQMSMKEWTVIRSENEEKSFTKQNALPKSEQGNIFFKPIEKDEEKNESLKHHLDDENKISMIDVQNGTNSIHSANSHHYQDQLEFYEQCNRFFEDEEYHYSSQSQGSQQHENREEFQVQKNNLQSNHMSQPSQRNEIIDQIQNQQTHNQIRKSEDHSNDSNKQKMNQDQSGLKSHQEFSGQLYALQQSQNLNVINQEVISFNENTSETQQIRPSYQFSIYISRTQMTLQSSINLNKNTEFLQNCQNQEKVEFFDENNQFEDLFGLKSQEQDPQKRKKYEVFKKYLIFYNQENQDQSSEQPISVAPKRVKWLDDQKKTKLKTGQKQLRKQVKLSQPVQPELMNFHPRTRSEKLRMIKMIEQSKTQEKSETKKPYMEHKRQNQRSEKKIENRIVINEEQKYDHEEDIQEKKQCSVKQIPIIQLSDSIHAYSSQSDHHSEDNENDKENFRIAQNQTENEMHKRNEKPFRPSIEHFQNKEESHGKTSMPILHPLCPSATRNNVPSEIQALRHERYCYLPDSPFAFMRRNELFSGIRDGSQSFKEEKKIKMQKVSLKGRFHDDIKQQLSVIDEHFIEELIIYCDTMECAVNEQSVAIICKMTKLKKLCIYWTYKLSKVLTKKIIASLPMLEELVLCELQDIDTEIANDIVHKLPNLRRFHYASDYMKNLDKMQENLEFLIDFVGTSTKLAPLFTLSKVKNLETFWVSDIEDVRQVRQILYNMKNLKQVSISAFQKRNKDLNTIFTALSKKKSLISLSLQGLQFKQDNLVTVIRSNPDLNTIIINECPTITNNTISAIAETCKNLEQLFLMLTDSLQGERIFQLKKLRTLVVRACWSINAPKFREGIKKLQNLQYLSLNMNNYWLGDDMLPSIGTLSNLIFLNLDTTKVTDKGMQHLVGLRNLETLVCGRTQITANGLYKFLEKTKSKIRKLGLSRQSNEELNRPEKINKHDVIYTEFEGHYLIKIGQLIPELTHLSIGGFRNLLIEHFATLDNLKCLQYKLESLPEETEKFLENTRLNLNANF